MNSPCKGPQGGPRLGASPKRGENLGLPTKPGPGGAGECGGGWRPQLIRRTQGRLTGPLLPPAVLSVFTHTPHLQARLGQDVLLDCGLSAPSVAFSVEWRHQHSGAGQVILAYDGAAQRVSVAKEGARLFLDPASGNISLQLQGVQVNHEGIYICSAYLPHLHAQQAMELRIVGEWFGRAPPPSKALCHLAAFLGSGVVPGPTARQGLPPPLPSLQSLLVRQLGGNPVGGRIVPLVLAVWPLPGPRCQEPRPRSLGASRALQAGRREPPLLVEGNVHWGTSKRCGSPGSKRLPRSGEAGEAELWERGLGPLAAAD